MNLCTTTSLRSLPAVAELAQHNQWTVWKLQERANKRGEIKEAKIPYNPRTHCPAARSLADHYTSFETACSASSRYNGIGFVFTADDPYSGVDLDGCRDPITGRIEHWAWRWIMRLNSYTEISPSGTGLKIFVRGVLPESAAAELGTHKGIELYSQKRYFCVTGQHLPGTPKNIRDAQEELTRLYILLTRLRRLRRFKQRPRSRTNTTFVPTPRTSPAENAVGWLDARETIDRANREHDLGDLLVAYGATLVAIRGVARYYDGLHGDVHDHQTTYVISPARNGIGHIGHSYSPNGRLNNNDFQRGFRWFDALVALEHGGDVVAALKAVTPLGGRAARSQAPRPSEMPEYLTVEDAERRRQWREQKQQQSRREREERQHLIRQHSNLIANDARLGRRERDAWAVHCVFFASTGRHCVSVAAQAARLCSAEQADESHVRRMQRANERLIACGYLQRTDRRDGSNRQTSWWEPCSLEEYRVTDASAADSNAEETTSSTPPDADRVTPTLEAHRVTAEGENGGAVTLEDQEIHTVSQSRACEGGGKCDEDEPEPMTEGASFDADAAVTPSGQYTGRTKHLLTFGELWDASTCFWQAQRDQALLIEEPEASPLPEPPRQRRQGEGAEITSLDRYRAKVAMMGETQLAGELKKHRRTLQKYAGKPWLVEVERRVRAVEAEIDHRAVPVSSKAVTPSHVLPSLYQQPLFVGAPP